MTEMDTLRAQGYLDRWLPDQRRLTVQLLLWNQAMLGIGPKPPMHDAQVFEDTWDFPTVGAALHAMQEWNPEKSPEPEGWHRHMRTGRYRIDGLASMEYVKGTGKVEEQVAHAAMVAAGSGHILLEEVTEESGTVGPSFPEGTQCLTVIIGLAACDHEPKCVWEYTVYHYLDRSVALSMYDLGSISIGDVIDRLTL